MSTSLPVAESRAVRRYARAIARRYPRMLWGAVTLHVLAALAGLAAPRLIGDLVQGVQDGTTTGHVDRIILLLAGFLVIQTLLTRYARYVSQVLGERVLAELREDFVGSTLSLPLGVVESAGSGDLLTRTGRDVDQLGWSVRWALPEWTIAMVTAVVTFAAALSVGWWVLVPCLLGLPSLVIGLRWYLARAKDGYLREGASYSRINATLTETVDGARTVEALGLGKERIEAIDADIKESYAAERYTLYLRTVFFPSMELSYLIPTVSTLLLGGYLYMQGSVSLADVTAATLYVQMLIDPVARVVSILDELQLGAASLARLLGVAECPTTARPRGAGRRGGDERLRRRFSSSRDMTCSTASTSTWRRGAARHRRPFRCGQVHAGTVAGRHPPAHHGLDHHRRCGAGRPGHRELRRHVALVTQEHHVFCGTLRDNLLRRQAGARRGGARPPSRRSTRGTGRPNLALRPRSGQARRGCRRVRRSNSPSRALYWLIRVLWCWMRRLRCSARGLRGSWSAGWPRCCEAGRSSPSRTSCTERTMLTGS